jgi:hypothetical protein
MSDIEELLLNLNINDLWDIVPMPNCDMTSSYLGDVLAYILQYIQDLPRVNMGNS